MEKIEKIYFDLDGVLADFDGGVYKLCGKYPVKQSNGDDEFIWDAMRSDEHFFANLEPIAGAVEMFNQLREKYGNRCEVLSAIPQPFRNMPGSKEDKIHWCRRWLGEDVVLNLVYRAEKKNFCKGKEYILVDDYEKNIIEWEEAGGRGLLFKNPEDVMELLENIPA